MVSARPVVLLLSRPSSSQVAHGTRRRQMPAGVENAIQGGPERHHQPVLIRSECAGRVQRVDVEERQRA